MIKKFVSLLRKVLSTNRVNNELPPFFLVLGMHRSGTSCLTGSLESCGVSVGDVSRQNTFNEKGNFEIRTIKRLNEQILNSMKASWKNPPNKLPSISWQQKKEMKKHVQEMIKNRPCAMKDPRCMLLLKHWKKIIGNPYQAIGTFRHPLAVAKSLNFRNKFTMEQGLQLWIKYNTILINEHKKNPFPIIHYDLSVIELYKRNLIKIAERFDLIPNIEQLNDFITPDLSHQHEGNEAIPENCKAIYDYLLKHKISEQA